MFKMCKIFNLATIAAVSLMANTSSADTVLAAWDTFGDTTVDIDPPGGSIALAPDISNFSPGSAFSFSGALDQIRNDRGSNDGTFGSAVTGADVNPVSGQNQSIRLDRPGFRDEGQEFFINITAADDLDFSTFHFDAGNNPNPVDTFGDVTLSFIDGAGVENFLTSGGTQDLEATGTDGTTGSGTANWLDRDFDVSQFSLAAGDTGAFKLFFFDSPVIDGFGGSSVHLDNFAITVAAVPEPSSLAVLGLLGLGFVTRRRR